MQEKLVEQAKAAKAKMVFVEAKPKAALATLYGKFDELSSSYDTTKAKSRAQKGR